MTGQESLFPIEEAAVPEQLQQPEQFAPFVNLNERAKYLERALDLLNQSNALHGLVAGGHAPQHRPHIERRYGPATNQVLADSEKKAERLEIQTKNTFAFASGMYAMTTSGVPDAEAKAITRTAYEEFTDVYGVGVTHAGERNKMMRKLRRQRTQG